MRTNPRTLLAIAATGLAVMLSASACAGTSSGSDGPGDTNPSPTAAVDASPITCQVSAPELYIYLQGNKAMFSQAGSPSALDSPVCVTGFAVAQVKAKTGASPEYVLFSYDIQNVHWTVVAVGASGLCAGKIPDALAKSLPGCGA